MSEIKELDTEKSKIKYFIKFINNNAVFDFACILYVRAKAL